MDLKTFVTETLTQVVAGIADAKEQIAASGTGAQINPFWKSSESSKEAGRATPVEFDVAITVMSEGEETAGGKASGKVGFLSVVSASFSAEGAAEAKEGRRNESTSRVKFSVMLAQPSDANVSQPIRQSSYLSNY